MIPTPALSEDHPFWGWTDLALILGAILPIGLASIFVTRLIANLGAPLSLAATAILIQFLAYGLLFVVIYLIFRLRYSRPLWRSLGFTGTPALTLRYLLLGPVVALAIGALGVLLKTPDINVPLMEMLNTPEAIALVGLFAVTLGPVCEELLFRGLLYPLLAKPLGPIAAILIAAAPFALLHGPQYGWSWRHVVLIGLAGSAFGWVRYKTGSTLAASALHSTYNLAFLVAFLLKGDTQPKC